MQIGTKTLLYGGHQFILHPACVYIAWVKIFRKLPNWKEAVCIFIHDWGYWGLPNLDGPEGEDHPLWAAHWALKHFDHFDGKDNWYYDNLCRYHSRFMAKSYQHVPSKLCAADKLGITLYPTWLWYFLTKLSGELKEYQESPKYKAEVELKVNDPKAWFDLYRVKCREWVKSGRIYTHIDSV